MLLLGAPRIDLRIGRTRINECHTESLRQSASDALIRLAPVAPHGRQGHRLLVVKYQFDLEYFTALIVSVHDESHPLNRFAGPLASKAAT